MNLEELVKDIKEYLFINEKNRTWNSIEINIINEELEIGISNFIIEYYCSSLEHLKVKIKIENDKKIITENNKEFIKTEELMTYLNNELLKKINNTDLNEFKYPDNFIIHFEAYYTDKWVIDLKNNFNLEVKEKWNEISPLILENLKSFDKDLSYLEKEKIYDIVKVQLISHNIIEEDFYELFKDIECFKIVYNKSKLEK